MPQAPYQGKPAPTAKHTIVLFQWGDKKTWQDFETVAGALDGDTSHPPTHTCPACLPA
jgi:hypothetical protein